MNIHPERVHTIITNSPKPQGTYVLYWMQQSQRIQYNHALLFARELAEHNSLPLVIGFVITDSFPGANYRHYAFMIEGLLEVQEACKAMKVPCVFLQGSPVEALKPLLDQAAICVMDRGYLRIQREWRKSVADYIQEQDLMPVYEIESDILVPVESASGVCEPAARTIRGKIKKRVLEFSDIHADFTTPSNQHKLPVNFMRKWKNQDLGALLDTLNIDRSIAPSTKFRGGSSEAHAHLSRFITERLPYYALANDPSLQYSSNLSPYIHFGQISVLEIADALERLQQKFLSFHRPMLSVNTDSFIDSISDFWEQLIIRRELAINFTWYTEGYDTYQGMTTSWAYQTLDDHRADTREYLYSFEALQRAETHDPYWNACMKELLITGKMHGYMRMYWAKKILEWSETPEEAYAAAVTLNDTYSIDGRDPNGYTGIAWCFGRHDHPWKERAVFGKIRYMNSKGLERKFSIKDYVTQVALLG